MICTPVIAKLHSRRIAVGIVALLCVVPCWVFGQEQDRAVQEMIWIADKRADWYQTGIGLSDQVPEVPAPEPATAPAQQEEDLLTLPPLELELDYHGGSYLYEPTHPNTRQLPPGYVKPRPLTAFQEFLGADMIAPPPNGDGVDFAHEPRFVGYGSYSLIGIGFDGNNPNVAPARQRLTGIGHQLIVDLDYRWTGTERVHVQFRPLGRENTGGSLLLLDGPVDYDDNSTLIPQRFWIEGELFSLFGNACSEETTPLDYHFTVGKYPFTLHNSLLVNDELVGAVINKNTLLIPPLSNMNVQMFYGYDDGEALEIPEANLAGMHVSADYRHLFFELTLAGSFSENTSRQAAYTALSVTRLWGPYTFAGRALGRWADNGPNQRGGLFVLEGNRSREFSGEFREWTGWESAVSYINLFYANAGWQSMAGGNFNRLRSAFAVNPLVAITRSPNPAEQYGVALGTQFFRNHEDTSFTPEIAFEQVSGTPRAGIGGTFLTQLGRRTFLDLRGVAVWSDNTALRQQGVFSSVFFVF
ncbi:MAG: hypothetical protein KDA84_05790 [Planctomycetaceae bacterium]|nr:hypothetical protein [Planctomycetaceae bacterium]